MGSHVSVLCRLILNILYQFPLCGPLGFFRVLSHPREPEGLQKAEAGGPARPQGSLRGGGETGRVQVEQSVGRWEGIGESKGGDAGGRMESDRARN